MLRREVSSNGTVEVQLRAAPGEGAAACCVLRGQGGLLRPCIWSPGLVVVRRQRHRVSAQACLALQLTGALRGRPGR